MATREPGDSVGPDDVREAEAALKRLGYARVAPGARDPPGQVSFWVQESGVPRRTFPVFVQPKASAPPWGLPTSGRSAPPRRAIVVVPTESAAEAAWASLHPDPSADPLSDLSILILHPASDDPAGEPRWHARTTSRSELLRISTGVVVGLIRRAQAGEEGSQVDFSELLSILRHRFGVDVHRTLGVESDEDALFLLYQLAQREAYAPGDPGPNLHLLVLKPTGPAARLPWFAA